VFLEPRAWLLVLVLSLLGLAVRLAAYRLGQGGMEAVSDRFPQIKAQQWERGRELLQTRGAWIFVFSGVPGVGIVLVAAAGALEVRLPAFILWVSAGMLVRYWTLLLIVIGGYHLITG
jgi:membrane protein YqaA with SNARE-associated domain